MTRDRQRLGVEGEARAARFLESRGYQIVARNVRADRVEIDLIAKHRDRLVIVEVKTRRSTGPEGFGRHGRAAEAVDARKQARLRRGALAWLRAHPAQGNRGRLRFDVVTCLYDAAAGASPDLHAPRNNDTAHPKDARWSFEHWEAAF